MENRVFSSLETIKADEAAELRLLVIVTWQLGLQSVHELAAYSQFYEIVSGEPCQESES